MGSPRLRHRRVSSDVFAAMLETRRSNRSSINGGEFMCGCDGVGGFVGDLRELFISRTFFALVSQFHQENQRR